MALILVMASLTPLNATPRYEAIKSVVYAGSVSCIWDHREARQASTFYPISLHQQLVAAATRWNVNGRDLRLPLASLSIRNLVDEPSTSSTGSDDR